jgi:Polyketide cyclase / dehydrase and lipid transport
MQGGSMLKIITIGAAVVAVFIAVVLAYAATQPDRFQVQRSTDIKASADKIFPLINDLRTFNTWNPFDKKDPSIKGSYGGPASGKGASYAFESAKAGTGSIEIVDTAPPSKVTMKLIMSKPIAADNRVQFTLEPQGSTTRVTWAMDGQVPFVGKVIHLILNIDKMAGGEFEAGLADLKALTEKSSSPAG